MTLSKLCLTLPKEVKKMSTLFLILFLLLAFIGGLAICSYIDTEFLGISFNNYTFWPVILHKLLYTVMGLLIVMAISAFLQ